jgi:hypothetical protein
VTHRIDRTNDVEAMQLGDNAVELAAWADGTVVEAGGRIVVRLPLSAIPVTVGQWAVRDVVPDGLGPARAVMDAVMVFGYRHIEGLRYRRRVD